MTERLRRAGSLAWALCGIAALVAVVGLVAWYVRVIFPPLILAASIVFILNPIVTYLQRRGVPRAAGAGLAYAGVLALIALGIVGLYPLAADQIEELSDEWPRIEDKVQRWIDDRAIESEGTFFEFSRTDINDALDNSGDTFEEQLDRVRRLGAEIFHVLLILVLAPFLAFYLLVDVPHLRRVSESLVPDAAKPEVMAVAHRLNRAIGGFFRGQLLVAFIVGILCSIGLGLIGLRFWFLVGMIAGLFNVIPLIGPWVGGIPGVTIALTTGSPFKALLVVLIMVGVQQLDNHFITPQVMQRAVHLHPAAVILALVAGGSIAGFFGLVLAVPAAASLKIILGHLWRVHVLGQPIEGYNEDDNAPAIGMVTEVEDLPENQGDPDAGLVRPDGGDEARQPAEVTGRR